jgi:CRP/FNR family transcriptional regulator, anaerobic regulatory protein
LDQFENIKNYYKRLIPDVDELAWQDFVSRLKTVTYRKGDVISCAGEVNNYVLFLNKGIARIFSEYDGKEVSGYFFMENEFVAEYESFITRKPAKCSIDALEDCEALKFSYDDTQQLYKRHHQIETFGRLIAEFLFIDLSDRNAELTTLSPEERYLLLLKQMPGISQRVPQYMIASYLNLTPEALSRIKKRVLQVG